MRLVKSIEKPKLRLYLLHHSWVNCLYFNLFVGSSDNVGFSVHPTFETGSTSCIPSYSSAMSPSLSVVTPYVGSGFVGWVFRVLSSGFKSVVLE